jgi:sigma-E factor negative regulatory protein RseA
MKQHISMLMDGELFDDEASALFDKMKHQSEGLDEWTVYHLISDVLRQPDHIHADISNFLRERLKDEPTVLAPYGETRHRARWFAVSAAASVLALAVVVWLSAQVAPEAAAPQVAMQQQPNVRTVGYSVKRDMNDYLMAHQEYSPATSVQGATVYIRTVAEQ